MERKPLDDAIEGWLVERPLSLEELTDRAVTAGFLAPDVDDEGFGPEDHVQWLIEGSDSYWTRRAYTIDEAIVLARSFTESGMTFTHRVTAEEVAAQALDEMPDLSVLLWECRRGLPLDDGGGRVDVDHSEIGRPRLVGPPDWIAAVEPGDLVAFTRTDGVLSFHVLAEEDLGDGTAEVQALLETAPLWIGDGRGSEEVPVVMEALARNPGLFRSPVPPVGDLLEAIGLERRGDEWGWADEDWRTRRDAFSDREEAIRARYGMNPCCDEAYERVVDGWRAHLVGDDVDERSIADDLGHGSVAAVFVHARPVPAALVPFAVRLVESTRGRRAAPPLTALGLAHLAAFDGEAAYEALDAAVRADPGFPQAAVPLALLELDRGDLARAHRLAVRSGAPDLADWIGAERSRRGALRPTAERNDPCPCGSGRKFKNCCARGGSLSLAQRFPWILQRVAHFATGPEGYDQVFGLAVSAAGEHEDIVGAIRSFLDDPFIVDVAIHEGGVLEDYLEQRAPLLADDEVDLLDQALVEPRRLWEIMAVDPGESLTLRDTGSGDEVTVVEHSGSRGREPGELLLARVVTVEGVAMLIGVPILISLRERDRVLQLLDGWVDADSLAMWFGSTLLPPRLTNREGEELVTRRTVCRVHDDAAAVAALDDAYERPGDEPVWHEMIDLDEHERVVRGTLRFDPPILTVESNSEQRQQRLLAALEGLVEYTIVEDDTGLADERVDDLEHLDPGAMPDDLRELMEQNMREYEQRWVEEPIPALDGLTPRQALDDPTRREDLFALLREMRSFQPPEGAVGMSVERVERLLGIEGR